MRDPGESTRPASAARREIEATLALGLPLAAAQLAHLSLGLVAAASLGALGSGELASGALGGAFFSTLLVIGHGIVSPVGPLAAEALGAADRERSARVGAGGLWVALGLSALAVPALLGAGPALRALGEPPALVAGAEGYLGALAWGFPAAMGFSALRHFASALGQARAVAAFAGLGALVALGGNALVVRGLLGGWLRGAEGVGAVTALSYWLALGGLGGHLVRAGAFASAGRFGAEFGAEREVLRLGLPVGVLFGLESALFSVSTLWAGLLGPSVLAAHQIVVQSAYVTFLVPSGLGMATAVRVGRALGARSGPEARLAAYTGIGLGAAFMALMAGVFWLLPGPVVGLFLDGQREGDREAAHLAAGLLSIAAVFQIADGVQGVAAGALRGLRDTRWPMLLGLATYGGVGLSLAYLLGLRWGQGARGLWWGLAFGLVAAAAALVVRLEIVLRRREGR